MSARFTAAICGLGRIGWSFGRSATGDALSHAAAYADQSDIRLAGGCDPSAQNRQEFASACGGQTFAALEEMLDAFSPDIVSICSPTNRHQEQTLACIRRGVPMIWLEKPPAEDLQGLETLCEAQAVNKSRSTVLVNYQRRYSLCYTSLAKAFAEQDLGRPVRLSVQYSCGLATNGVHLVDLAFFLTGDAAECSVQWVDRSASAENPDFGLRFDDGLRAVFQGDALPYHNIDVSLICQEGRLSILHGGLTTQVERRVENELYPGFFRLAPVAGGLLGPGGLDGSLARALEDLLQSHGRGGQPRSNLATALRAQKVLHHVLAGASA